MSDACPTCDREECAVSALQAVVEAGEANNPSDVDAFILASATCDAHAHDWRAEALALRAEVAALKARPLTVASALALPEVQSGACVVERRRVLHLSDGRALCFYDQYKITDRCLLMRGDDEDTDDGSHWTVWERVPVGPDPWLIAMPARLVPLADADLDPATRGPMP